MSEPIYKALDNLPERSMTTRMLGGLDWVVPGQWKNIVGFENMIRHVSGETDEEYIQKIGERAIALFNDPKQGYQRALWLYQTVDNVQAVAGVTAMLSKIGESVSFLSFLDRVTPKADTTQAVDFGIKLIVELVAFCKLNGLPGDSTAEFVESLTDYRDEALMRMAALICVDGMIPLGPDFMQKVLALLDRTGARGLEKDSRFQKVRSMLPGKNTQEQLAFMENGVKSVQNWVGSFVASRNLTVDKLVGSLRNVMEGMDSKLDYVGAFIDMTTNYYEHTGTQSVGRSLISRAAGEV